MLIGTPTPRGTGILIEGDYYDLQALHRTIHRVAELLDKPESQPQYEWLLDLAYEVRHAMQGDRHKRTAVRAGVYYGFRYTWPVLLIMSNLLRSGASRSSPKSDELALLDLLEACIRAALSKFDPQGAIELAELVGAGIPTVGPLFNHVGSSLQVYYLSQRATKQRFRSLAKLINDYMSPGEEAYQQVPFQIRMAAAFHQCPTDEIEINDYPNKVTW